MMYSRIRRFQLIVILILAVFLLTTGFGCKQGNMDAVRELETPITLRYWRVFDGKDNFNDIISSYRRLHPNVNIEYRKLRYDEYEQALIEAWAEDRGPDIFSIHNSWVKKYQTKILPMPDSLKLPYVVSVKSRTGDIEKADYRQAQTLTPAQIRSDFVDVVYSDAVLGGKVMALPLSVDSLALFYNRTMFDNVGITTVPSTWVEVKEAVKRLTLQDNSGNILNAGIALGGADNINRASDILALLMMQNGTMMTDNSGYRAMFDQPSPYSTDNSYLPGAEALRFYTDFALPFKEVYSWNKDMPEATEAFIASRLGMMIGYSYQLPLIKAQGVRLNFGVAEIPHINSDGGDATGSMVNYASYWLETVSARTEYSDYAWDFIIHATKKENVESYLSKTKKPTALRSLVQEQVQDPDIAPFARQVLTAKSWYHGSNPQAAEDIFKQMIIHVVEGKNSTSDAIKQASSRINQTF